jgi:hypothetical protein
MRFAQVRRELLVVVAQLGQHVGRCHVGRVVVSHSLHRDMSLIERSAIAPIVLTRSAMASVVA